MVVLFLIAAKVGAVAELYVYLKSKISDGRKPLHSIIVDNNLDVRASADLGERVVFLAEKDNLKALPGRHEMKIDIDTYLPGDKVVLSAIFAFDNRGREKKNSPKMIPAEAGRKFMNLCGVKTVDEYYPSIQLVRSDITISHSFRINNTFDLHGLFEVDDQEKFNKALTDGIGSRRSYGFGIVFVERKLTNISEFVE